MAHNRSYKPEDILFPDQHITESNLVDEMEKSYIEYAMSVIVGRALPDVRDGLKPVHRRILYDMSEELGMTPDKPQSSSIGVIPNDIYVENLQRFFHALHGIHNRAD